MTVVILGAGIAGLSTAHYLLKSQGRKVVLIETSSRVGGWIRSDRHDDGVILEQGPRTLRPKGESGLNTLSLIDDLGLTSKIRPILSSSVAAKNRYVYANNNLYTLPSSFTSLFRTVPPFSKPLARALFHDLRSLGKRLEDDSIYNFVERRFGKDIADYAISPLICGICGGDARRISVNFLLSDFFKKENDYGSVTKAYLRPWNWNLKKRFNESRVLKSLISPLVRRARKEKWSSYSFTDGLEILPQTLKNKIEETGATILTNTHPVKIDLRKRKLYLDENEINFNFLVSAIPAPSLSNLLYEDYYSLANALQDIDYVSIITVNLVYKRKLMDIKGFGFLVPPSENLPILGVIFDHCYAPVKDWTILTVMMGGHAFDKYFSEDCSENYILKLALENVAKILNIKEAPDVFRFSVLRDCIPQQVVGHINRVTWIQNYIELEEYPMFLVGNAFKGVGINDVILSAKQTVEKINNWDKSKEDEYPTSRFKVEYL